MPMNALQELSSHHRVLFSIIELPSRDGTHFSMFEPLSHNGTFFFEKKLSIIEFSSHNRSLLSL